MGKNLRRYKKTSALSDKQMAELEAIPGWVWDPLEFGHKQNLGALQQFVEHAGHARPIAKHKEVFNGEEINLGSWVSGQRKYKKRTFFEMNE